MSLFLIALTTAIERTDTVTLQDYLALSIIGGKLTNTRAGEKMTKLHQIAEKCLEFEHLIQAMGYGYSLLNVSEGSFEVRCDHCVHWDDGNCRIYSQVTK